MEIYHQSHCSYDLFSCWIVNARTKEKEYILEKYLLFASRVTRTFWKFDFHHHTKDESCFLFTVETSFLLIFFFYLILIRPKEELAAIQSNAAQFSCHTWKKLEEKAKKVLNDHIGSTSPVLPANGKPMFFFK